MPVLDPDPLVNAVEVVSSVAVPSVSIPETPTVLLNVVAPVTPSVPLSVSDAALKVPVKVGDASGA